MSFALDRIPGFCDLPDVAVLPQRWTNASYSIISQNRHQETQRTPSANSCFRPWRLPLCPPVYPLSETISPQGRADHCGPEVLSSGPAGRLLLSPSGPAAVRPGRRPGQAGAGVGGGYSLAGGMLHKDAPRGMLHEECSTRMLR